MQVPPSVSKNSRFDGAATSVLDLQPCCHEPGFLGDHYLACLRTSHENSSLRGFVQPDDLFLAATIKTVMWFTGDQ